MDQRFTRYLSAWLYFHELAHTDVVGAGFDSRECTGIVAETTRGNLVQLANMDPCHVNASVALEDALDVALNNMDIYWLIINYKMSDFACFFDGDFCWWMLVQ